MIELIALVWSQLLGILVFVATVMPLADYLTPKSRALLKNPTFLAVVLLGVVYMGTQNLRTTLTVMLVLAFLMAVLYDKHPDVSKYITKNSSTVNNEWSTDSEETSSSSLWPS